MNGNNSLSVVILAAGQGKRMSTTLPKIFHLLAGKSLLKRVYDVALSLKAQDIFFVVNHTVQLALASELGYEKAKIILQPESLGTGHALLCTLSQITTKRVLVLSGDTPCITKEILSPLIQSTADICFLTAMLDAPTGYGRIVRAENGQVRAIIEEKDATEIEKKIKEVNTGVYSFNTIFLSAFLSTLSQKNAQKEYYLTDLLAIAASENKRIEAIPLADPFYVRGINTLFELSMLEDEWLKRDIISWMQKGVRFIKPDTIQLRGNNEIAADVIIDSGAILENVSIAAGTYIGPYTVIKNTIISSGVIVHAYSHIENAEIGEHCSLGPYARLRPGTFLADDVRIGNFVEIKETFIGKRSKVGHLTYLGDAKIDANVNIGAGTVTCNFDGKKKHHTIIEQDAFIGSGAMLVAPLCIGEKATIAAGSVITKDVESNTLGVARARQCSKARWVRPIDRAEN